jgi:hypothetical protein
VSTFHPITQLPIPGLEKLPATVIRTRSFTTGCGDDAPARLSNEIAYQSMFAALSISCVIHSIRYSISSIDFNAPSYVPSLAYGRMIGKVYARLPYVQPLPKHPSKDPFARLLYKPEPTPLRECGLGAIEPNEPSLSNESMGRPSPKEELNDCILAQQTVGATGKAMATDVIS